jgi:hypothetical protein
MGDVSKKLETPPSLEALIIRFESWWAHHITKPDQLSGK